MTHEQACREIYERLEPFHKLKADVMMRVPMDLIVRGQKIEPSPRPSERAKELLANIDAMMDTIVRQVADKITERGMS